MKTLAETAVRDLMQTNVVTVGPDATIRELTRLLSDHQISGAPVVDAGGRVLGVVSATDVLRFVADEVDATVATFPTAPSRQEDAEDDDDEPDLLDYFALVEGAVVAPEGVDWITADAFEEGTVKEIMTPVHFSVRSDASVEELADLLFRGRIHRALVIDDDELEGIVTTFDILKALARA